MNNIYGIWRPDHPDWRSDDKDGHWLRDSRGHIFQSPSRGVMIAMLREILSDVPVSHRERVAMFGEDGYPVAEESAAVQPPPVIRQPDQYPSNDRFL